MSVYELGMSLDYPKNWGIVDGVREFFQNALDEEKENPENKMFYQYKEGVLTIGNKYSKLSKSSLLLGASTKSDKSNLIGKHGEGYKVATVVLMRNGITVKIYNNEAKEVWESKIVNSRRYDSKIVVFEITKGFIKRDENLVIELSGISNEDWSKIVESNLHLRDDLGEVKNSDQGMLLLDPKFKGKIYVEGLYVTTESNLDWGYNFNANMIKLDRDRGLVDFFDLKFAVASLIVGTNDVDFITENINSRDLQFVHHYLNFKEDSIASKVGIKVYNSFVEEYGEDAIPTNSYEEFNKLKSEGCKPILVQDQVYRIISKGGYNISSKTRIPVNTRYEIWKKKAEGYLPSDLIREIDELWKIK